MIYEEDFEGLLQKQVLATGLSENTVREEMIKVLEREGYRIIKAPLAVRLEAMRRQIMEDAVISNLEGKGLRIS